MVLEQEYLDKIKTLKQRFPNTPHLQSNVLLAYFIGGRLQKKIVWEFEDFTPTNFCYTSELDFHSNWNMLMLAVEKINEKAKVIIYPVGCTISSAHFGEIKVLKSDGITLYDTFNPVYAVCVQYVERYYQKGKK